MKQGLVECDETLLVTMAKDDLTLDDLNKFEQDTVKGAWRFGRFWAVDIESLSADKKMILEMSTIVSHLAKSHREEEIVTGNELIERDIPAAIRKIEPDGSESG